MRWSKKDILEYSKIRRKELSPLYGVERIGLNRPDKREEYLRLRVLHLTLDESSLIEKTSSEEGKAQALKMLEDIAVDRLCLT